MRRRRPRETMLSVPKPDLGQRQIDLARQLATHAGKNPDQPLVDSSAGGQHVVRPAWQRYYTLAGAALQVMEEQKHAAPTALHQNR